MKTFKSIAALEAAAKASARKTLNYQVKDLVEKKIREKAQEVVYDSYSPTQYVRRGGLGTVLRKFPEHTHSVSSILTQLTPRKGAVIRQVPDISPR